FLGGAFNTLFDASVPQLNLIQPLGISFYSLQAISYITDIYRGKYEACKNPLRISLYLSFMLTIVEGPVARYNQLGTQLNNCAYLNFKDFELGAQRVFWGLFKKIVVADRVSELVNNVFDRSEDYGGAIVIAAILAYTLQLYCEFSGVMDVINGLGKMIGIEMPENFNRPFFAKTINEFWQRWHITLGGWLRDYVFYPISLSKPFMKLTMGARKKFNPYYANLIPTSVALFFVWFSNGMWHGAGWKYIVYGLYYYVLMMFGLFLEPLSAKACKALKINRKSKSYSLFQIIRTFVIVNGGMLIFRADNLHDAVSMFASIFTNFSLKVLVPGAKNGLGLDIKDYIIVAIGIVIIFAVGVLQERQISISQKISEMKFPIKFIIYMAAIFVIIIFGAYGENYG
ncbi:MAG: MBOAT family protein, partial [Eubacterium sp.]|nr:MBOAT family protein [Eubacterium sp.]